MSGRTARSRGDVVRPEFRPSLPVFLRRRFGIPAAVTLAVAGVAFVVAAVLIARAIARPPAPGTQVVHSDPPVFNLLYPPDLMHEARARPGELMRIEGRRGKLSVAVVVRPLRLPHYNGDVIHGLLPVYADRFADAQAKILPGFQLASEGRLRVNNAFGYEIAFQSVRPHMRTYGRDALLAPEDPAEGPGLVTLSLRQVKPGGAFTAAEGRLAFQSRKTYKSFTFGTSRE
jgi:hypothetical protein